MRELAVFSLFGLFLLACGGVEPSPEAPVAEAEPRAAELAPPPTAKTVEEQPPQDAPRAEKPAPAEPQFTDGMSVEDATKAVPQGSERANIDQETLSKPIQDFAVYEPCKPGAAHLKLKVAVWGGKAVGIDVTASPKNDKLVACVKDRIKSLTWQAHVKSLNTVEYSF